MTIAGKVEEFVNIKPKRIKLVGLPNEHLKGFSTITCKEKYPFSIVSTIAKKGDNIRFKLEEKSKSKPVRYILSVENKKKNVGRYHDIIYLKTSSSIYPQIKVYVFGNIRDNSKK